MLPPEKTRGQSQQRADERSIAAVIGYVLVVGLVGIVAIGLLVGSLAVFDGAQGEIGTTQATTSVSALAATIDDVSARESATRPITVRGGDRGDVRVIEDAGRIRVVHDASGLDYETELGALVYRDGGRTIAYQGGGVWRSDDGATTMLRPPALSYRSSPVPTVTIPVVAVRGDLAGTVPARGTMRLAPSETRHPTPADRNPIREGSPRIEVESTYCTGWQGYFEQRTGWRIVDGCGNDDTVIAEVSAPFRLTGVDYAIRTEAYDGHGSEDVDLSAIDERPLDVPSSDPLVGARANDCDGEFESSLPSTVTEGGLHCVERIDSSVTFDTDAAGEEIHVYARDGGSLGGGQSVRVEGDYPVSLYFDDDLRIGGGARIGEQTDPTKTRLFLSSGATIVDFGDSEIYALLYAPNSVVEFSGAVTFEGAIVAERVTVNSASASLAYASGFDDVEIRYEDGGEPTYYFHLTERTAEFRR